MLTSNIAVPPTTRKRKHEPEENNCKKPRQEDKDDGHKEGTPESKEESHENKPQDSEEDEATEEDDYLDDEDGLFLIDPRLRKWDRDHDDFGDGNAGNGGSGLPDQILSSNIIAATG